MIETIAHRSPAPVPDGAMLLYVDDLRGLKRGSTVSVNSGNYRIVGVRRSAGAITVRPVE